MSNTTTLPETIEKTVPRTLVSDILEHLAAGFAQAARDSIVATEARNVADATIRSEYDNAFAQMIADAVKTVRAARATPKAEENENAPYPSDAPGSDKGVRGAERESEIEGPPERFTVQSSLNDIIQSALTETSKRLEEAWRVATAVWWTTDLQDSYVDLNKTLQTAQRQLRDISRFFHPNIPTTSGFYWAKCRRDQNQWITVQVFWAEPENLRVFVPGVKDDQPVDDFTWGLGPLTAPPEGSAGDGR